MVRQNQQLLLRRCAAWLKHDLIAKLIYLFFPPFEINYSLRQTETCTYPLRGPPNKMTIRLLLIQID